MERITTLADFYQSYDQAKHSIPNWISNFYPNPERIAALIEQGLLYHASLSSTFFFLEQTTRFWRVFYCAATPNQLENSLRELSRQHAQQFVIDILSPTTLDAALSTALQNSGYRFYACFQRMRLAQKNVPQRNAMAPIHCADPEQAPQILALLEQAFDPLAEHLPNQTEIVAACEKQTILLAQPEGMIAGLLFYQQARLSSELRYWWVHPDWRKQKLGSALLYTYWQRAIQAQNHFLWVNTANQTAIEKYIHFGYTFDRLYDFIYVSPEEP